VEKTRSNNVHTVIFSDLHLSDAELPHEKSPLWKKFRQKQFFIDESFSKLLGKVHHQIREVNENRIELILNGDIFDFDSVMAMPRSKTFKVSSHEKSRGLNSEEHKSLFKITKILDDHDVWLDALRRFILNDGQVKGVENKIVFIIGNHDIELHWPKVQNRIVERLNLPDHLKQNVIFCEWFYVSMNDTLVEHGNQYDPYCMCNNPINPLVEKRKKIIIRLPFGNLANKYMVNGMGLKNPHNENSFLMNAAGFIRYFVKYEAKLQPFLIFYWLEGAIRTFCVYMAEGLLPPLKDPFTLKDRVLSMAKRSQCSPEKLQLLREYHAHPAVYRPLMVLRELWLDRVFFLILIIWGCFQFFSTANVFVHVSAWWFFIPVFVCLPFFTLYSKSVMSEVRAHMEQAEKKIRDVATVMDVKRVIQGHTHIPAHREVRGVEFLNTGSWTPIFHDAECEKPYGQRLFAWVKPLSEEELDDSHDVAQNRLNQSEEVSGNQEAVSHRQSQLCEWRDGKITVMPKTAEEG
jgi:UDP-2,3-diacylglucosamine pyrophosphatase LpxH